MPQPDQAKICAAVAVAPNLTARGRENALCCFERCCQSVASIQEACESSGNVGTYATEYHQCVGLYTASLLVHVQECQMQLDAYWAGIVNLRISSNCLCYQVMQ